MAFPTFPATFHEDDLMLWCEDPDCTLGVVMADTDANVAHLVELGDAHAAVNPTHDITLQPLIDYEWEWTETGEVLNGYETALRLVARAASQQ